MRKSEIERKILNYLLTSGAVILALQHPANMMRFLNRLPKDFKKYKEIQLKRALHRLRSHNKIEHIKDEGGKMIIRVTKEGRDYLEKVDFDNLALERPPKWDRKWRLIIFDIPEKKKIIREMLREKLKNMDFKRLQHSIWITPFSCEKEINTIKNIFNISDYWVDIIITENLGIKEFKMRKYFNLI